MRFDFLALALTMVFMVLGCGMTYGVMALFFRLMEVI